jgi:hypothetical protein
VSGSGLILPAAAGGVSEETVAFAAEFIDRCGSGGTATQTIAYSVPLTTAAGGPVNMDAAADATWNQTDIPASAAAIFPGNHVPASPPSASDWQYAQLSYYDANGMPVNTANYGSGTWNVTTTQFDGFGDVISELTADRAEALAAGPSSASVAAELSNVTSTTPAAPTRSTPPAAVTQRGPT